MGGGVPTTSHGGGILVGGGGMKVTSNNTSVASTTSSSKENTQGKFLSNLFLKYGNIRSSRPEVFCKKGVVRNFAKFTGKHLCQSLFFNKVVDSGTGVFL